MSLLILMNSIIYKIVEGKKIGKKIGFPTINLEPAKLESDFGVYLCEVVFENGKNYKGVLHYGSRKTVDEKITLEVHLLDFDQEVYEEEVELKLGNKIRNIKKFKDLEELKEQIKKDVIKIKSK